MGFLFFAPFISFFLSFSFFAQISLFFGEIKCWQYLNKKQKTIIDLKKQKNPLELMKEEK